MGFSMEDVMEVIQIVKECKDTELHIDTGDIKLSIFKGKVGNTARSPLCFSGHTGTSEQAAPAASPASAETPPATEAAVHAPAEAASVSESGTLPPAALDGNLDEENLHPIKATVPSVFYRRPGPDEPPFVEVGDEVEADTVLCLLEVMKCYQQLMAEVKGQVVKICVESNTLVEEGTTLFLIQPD